ncbi:MAG: hypothetical protein H0T69_04905 [Thermoleophilaceae bacterium]|nr:hypothetical protein [Thermoleophilaceae bacterium]
MEASDLLEALIDELGDARSLAAVHLDRAEALAEVLIRAELVAARHDQFTLTPEDLLDSPKDEQERAELTALCRRAYPDLKEVDDSNEADN